MEFETYLRFILVLVFVLGLVFVLAWVLKRSGISGSAIVGKSRRLGVIETAFLGPKHRLVLVRRDQVEHLVLIGPTSSAVVETGITGGAGATAKQSFQALVNEQADPQTQEPGA